MASPHAGRQGTVICVLRPERTEFINALFDVFTPSARSSPGLDPCRILIVVAMIAGRGRSQLIAGD